MFHEICIYEAKLDKQDEIEQLMKEVKEYYKSQKGVIDVFYIKRNHRQKDFNAVKAGEPPIALTRYIGKVTYMLHMILENKEAHANLCKKAMDKFYKRWTRCLITMPKILLGEDV
jgi:ATP phosphoribosyltransferase